MPIKTSFPFFYRHEGIVYFDNASTTQKPQRVLDALNEYWSEYCANAGRGSYTSANRVTKEVEGVREKVRDFIQAKSPNEIVFTSGATASLNTVAYAWGLTNLQSGDEVMVCLEDHDSNALPWINLQKILAKMGKQIRIVTFRNTSAGDANIEDILAKITKQTRLIVMTHIHNVYGTKSDVEILREKIDSKILISLDASQSIGHIPIDVQCLGVDFLSFSGHKMFASTGIGVLWINQRIHEQIQPFLVGGGVTEAGGKSEVVFKKMPYLLEGGTPNISGVISLGAAIDFIQEITLEKIQYQMLELSQYLLQQLRTLDKIVFLPGIAFCKCAVGYGIVSFNIEGISSSEVGFILNEHQIYVRTGTHCTGGGNELNDSVRVSLHVYNTKEEIDRLVEVLKGIIS